MKYKLNKEEQEKLQAWQIEEIKKSIAEADAGDLIEHSEILKLWKEKYSDLAVTPDFSPPH